MSDKAGGNEQSEKKEEEGNEDKEDKEDEITWDERYDNPASEIVLVSNDKVGFRVDCWFFKKHSDLIKDLMTIPSDQPLHNARFELDTSGTIVRQFVNLIYANSPIAMQLDTVGFQELFDLCGRFLAPPLTVLTSNSLRLSLLDPTALKKIDAWEAFAIGARMDDIELARAAIRTFDISVPDFASKPTSSYTKVPVLYCHALVSRFYGSGSIKEYSRGKNGVDWNYVGVWRPRTAVEIANCFALE